MPKLAAIFLIASCIAGCATAGKSTSESVSGCYEANDQRVYSTLQLRLNPDRSYSANLVGDVGSWGAAQGVWSLQDNTISLSPTQETGAMAGLFKSLAIKSRFGSYQLVPDRGWGALSSTKCRASFAKMGSNKSFKPNPLRGSA